MRPIRAAILGAAIFAAASALTATAARADDDQQPPVVPTDPPVSVDPIDDRSYANGSAGFGDVLGTLAFRSVLPDILMPHIYWKPLPQYVPIVNFGLVGADSSVGGAVGVTIANVPSGADIYYGRNWSPHFQGDSMGFDIDLSKDRQSAIRRRKELDGAFVDYNKDFAGKIVKKNDDVSSVRAGSNSSELNVTSDQLRRLKNLESKLGHLKSNDPDLSQREDSVKGIVDLIKKERANREAFLAASRGLRSALNMSYQDVRYFGDGQRALRSDTRAGVSISKLLPIGKRSDDNGEEKRRRAVLLQLSPAHVWVRDFDGRTFTAGECAVSVAWQDDYPREQAGNSITLTRADGSPVLTDNKTPVTYQYHVISRWEKQAGFRYDPKAPVFLGQTLQAFYRWRFKPSDDYSKKREYTTSTIQTIEGFIGESPTHALNKSWFAGARVSVAFF